MDDKRNEAKEPYAAPKLTVHGSVVEMTAAIGGDNMDGIGGSALD